ncbi:MAG TPA: hypothetical protein PLV52_06835, partial [Candidatus Omnitrophota bacterium]|nr:hypothetical protein [Candidatus Omnitrophota bacterium]
FTEGELDNDKNKFGDRFELDGVKGETGGDFVRSIIRRARGNEKRTIAVIPSNLSLSDKNINDLQELGIGFIRVDAEAISELRFASALERAQFRMDAYAIMWLARYVRDATPESGSYELLRFYLKTHFAFANAAEMDSYIDALVKGELNKLVKVYLRFRPSIPKDAEADYHRVAASLIFA